MSGLDDLLLILDFLISNSQEPSTIAVLDALNRLKQRQANHKPFDEQLPELG